MSPDGGVLDAKLEKPWYYQGGMISSSCIRQEKVPRFRAQVAFPLRESADYAIIGLLLKIACFGGNL